MPTDPDLLAHVLDLFEGIGPITPGRMFSGTALSVEGNLMFACILGGTVWMKSDATTESTFRAAGSEPFTGPRTTGTRQATSLTRLPDAAMENPDEALPCARLSRTTAAKRAQKPEAA